jgi:ribosome biogenesis GTPase / thiamine phosphate phosphatase
LPCVGDWVAVEDRTDENQTIIQEILPRKSKFSRKVAGDLADEQIVATNVDTIFLVSGLDQEFNERRIERYLAVAWDSGATPVVILNKLDVCDSPEEKKQQVEMIAPGVEIILTDAKTGNGVNELNKFCGFGKTVAFLGSSGVGKSTLVNVLIGEEKMKTGEIREDDSRGRHTTSHRELFFSPDGGMIIDTPGMREIQLWGEEDTLANAFSDVEELGEKCKFRNCIHENEPGCAVREAVDTGELSQARLNNYIKLKKELDYAARKKSYSNKWEERARDKEFGKMVKRVMKEKKIKGKK